MTSVFSNTIQMTNMADGKTTSDDIEEEYWRSKQGKRTISQQLVDPI